MPIKERRTKILLLLFLLSDTSVGQAGVNFDYIEINSTIQKIFDLSFNQKTKGMLSALLKEGLIEKNSTNPVPAEGGATAQAGENRNNQYRLTEKGYEKLCLDFPFLRFLKEEWDGRWRVISYEIPETKREIRDRLRREMRGWGLGPWHRSFWLTPHPIIENLRQLVYGREEEKYIQAFESTHVFGDLNQLVEKVWKRSDLEKTYRDSFKKWHTILSSEKKNDEKLKEIIVSYIELIRCDPGLPKGLVEQKWIGFEAYSIFKEVEGILLK